MPTRALEEGLIPRVLEEVVAFCWLPWTVFLAGLLGSGEPLLGLRLLVFRSALLYTTLMFRELLIYGKPPVICADGLTLPSG